MPGTLAVPAGGSWKVEWLDLIWVKPLPGAPAAWFGRVELTPWPQPSTKRKEQKPRTSDPRPCEGLRENRTSSLQTTAPGSGCMQRPSVPPGTALTGALPTCGFLGPPLAWPPSPCAGAVVTSRCADRPALRLLRAWGGGEVDCWTVAFLGKPDLGSCGLGPAPNRVR